MLQIIHNGALIRSCNTLSLVTLIALAGATIAPGDAEAMPQSSVWVEIPVVDSSDDEVDLTGYRCFRLYIIVEPGDTIQAADFGIAGPNTGLSTTQSLFQHPLGNDLKPSDLLVGMAPDLYYDTYVTLGSLDPNAAEVQTLMINFASPSTLSGAWFATNAPAEGRINPFVSPDAPSVLVAQITISSAGDYLDGTGFLEQMAGQGFVTGTGANGVFGRANPANGVYDIENSLSVDLGESNLGPFETVTCGAEHVSMHQARLDWQDALSADHYKVTVTSDFRLLEQVYAETEANTSELVIPADVLEPCTTYYWYPTAVELDGQSDAHQRLAANWRLCSFTTTSALDLNGDGAVNPADLEQLISVFNTADAVADVSGNGVVDAADLCRVIIGFGQSCE